MDRENEQIDICEYTDTMKCQKFAVSFKVFTFLAPKNLFRSIGFWKILSQ